MIITSITKHETGVWLGRASDGEKRFEWDCEADGSDICIEERLGPEPHEVRMNVRDEQEWPAGAVQDIMAAIAVASNAYARGVAPPWLRRHCISGEASKIEDTVIVAA